MYLREEKRLGAADCGLKDLGKESDNFLKLESPDKLDGTVESCLSKVCEELDEPTAENVVGVWNKSSACVCEKNYQ